MHDKFPKYLDNYYFDMELSFEWMKHAGLKGETEGLITAPQDQVLNTRYYSKHIIKQHTTDQCKIVSEPTRNSGTHHIRMASTSSRSVPKQAQQSSFISVDVQDFLLFLIYELL